MRGQPRMRRGSPAPSASTTATSAAYGTGRINRVHQILNSRDCVGNPIVELLGLHKPFRDTIPTWPRGTVGKGVGAKLDDGDTNRFSTVFARHLGPRIDTPRMVKRIANAIENAPVRSRQ